MQGVNCTVHLLWSSNGTSIDFKVVLLIFILIIFISVVVIGNLLVILVVANNRGLRSVTVLFITSLALADLCVGQCRSQEGGRGNFKLVMIQSNHRFGLAASSPNLSEVGSGPAASLHSASGRPGSQPSEPTRQTGFRQIWLLAAGTGWID